MSGAVSLLDGFSNERDIMSLQMICVCQRVRLKEGFWIFTRHLNFFCPHSGYHYTTSITTDEALAMSGNKYRSITL
jgi:hypothetical protein